MTPHPADDLDQVNPVRLYHLRPDPFYATIKPSAGAAKLGSDTGVSPVFWG